MHSLMLLPIEKSILIYIKLHHVLKGIPEN